MRINLYSQELTDEIKVVEKTDDDGSVYTAIMFMLHSSSMLHQPPDHVGGEDDRGAVAFWLPKSPRRRENLAQTFEEMAKLVRLSAPEDESESLARCFAGDHLDKHQIPVSPAERAQYIDEHWQDHLEEAKQSIRMFEREPDKKQRLYVESGTLNVWNRLRDAIEQNKIRDVLADLQKKIKAERESAGYNGSFQGQVVASEKQHILDRFREVLSPTMVPPSDLTEDSGEIVKSDKSWKEDKRIEILRLFLDTLMTSSTKVYSREDLRAWFSNAIYLVLTGTHEERLAHMRTMDLPPQEENPDDIYPRTYGYSLRPVGNI